MRRIRSLSRGLLAAALLAALARPALAQQKAEEPQPVTITTADLVKLKGYFYPSAKGEKATTVLLLHGLNEDSKKSGWVGLAKYLQGKGYAVLRFDFRGHGDSTTVEPGVALRKRGFWDERDNASLIKGANKRPSTIEAKQFLPGYLPVLINDIAAAKAWLDAAPCNANDLVLIGAKEGATLGAAWLNSEYSRFRVVPDPRRMQDVPDLENPEGAAVTAAVWLSIGSKLGNRTLNVPGLLKTAGENKIPMWFVYGKGDAAAKRTAVACEKAVKPKKGGSPFTGTTPVEGGKIAGSALLDGGLQVSIDQWLRQTEKDKNVRKSDGTPQDTYLWVIPRLRPQVARIRGRLAYNNYLLFLQPLR